MWPWDQQCETLALVCAKGCMTTEASKTEEFSCSSTALRLVVAQFERLIVPMSALLNKTQSWLRFNQYLPGCIVRIGQEQRQQETRRS